MELWEHRQNNKKVCKYETFGWEPKTSCKDEHSWLVVGWIRIKVATWRIACPEVDKDNLVLMSNGLAISCKRLIRDSFNPF